MLNAAEWARLLKLAKKLFLMHNPDAVDLDPACLDDIIISVCAILKRKHMMQINGGRNRAAAFLAMLTKAVREEAARRFKQKIWTMEELGGEECGDRADRYHVSLKVERKREAKEGGEEMYFEYCVKACMRWMMGSKRGGKCVMLLVAWKRYLILSILVFMILIYFFIFSQPSTWSS